MAGIPQTPSYHEKTGRSSFLRHKYRKMALWPGISRNVHRPRTLPVSALLHSSDSVAKESLAEDQAAFPR